MPKSTAKGLDSVIGALLREVGIGCKKEFCLCRETFGATLSLAQAQMLDHILQSMAKQDKVYREPLFGAQGERQLDLPLEETYDDFFALEPLRTVRLSPPHRGVSRPDDGQEEISAGLETLSTIEMFGTLFGASPRRDRAS